MTRRHELDLARALAVSAVLVGHAGYAAGLHPVAARGVDVFLVLSGYLCASQLARGADPSAWLWRRLRRVYPAAWVVLALCGACTPAAVLLLDFGLPPPSRLVGHYWSLAVEVSGYVGLAALALAPRRAWAPVLAMVVVGCALGRLAVDDGAAYRVLRWDGMAVGALWALRGAPARAWLAVLLPVSLMLPVAVAPLPAALGAVGLLSALRGATLRADWLCSRSFVLYLVHQPLIEVHGFIGLALTPLAAEALWRLVDRYAVGSVAGPMMHQPSASLSPRGVQPDAVGTA